MRGQYENKSYCSRAIQLIQSFQISNLVGSPHHETKLLEEAADSDTTRDESNLWVKSGLGSSRGQTALGLPTLPMLTWDRSQSANLKHGKRVRDNSLLQSRAVLSGQGKCRKRSQATTKK